MDRSELKKVGILGGTFDPPHLAHLRIAEEVREAFNLLKIFFIPAGYPPHKKTGISPFKARFEMTKIAIKNNPFFEVLDVEKEENPSYTLKTLQKLKKIDPLQELYLIIGWDSFCELHTWWRYEEFLNYTKIVVVSREIKDYKNAEKEFLERIKKLWKKEKLKDKVYFYKVVNIEISGTLIRKLYSLGRSIRYLVPQEVYKYIKEKGLYKDERQG